MEFCKALTPKNIIYTLNSNSRYGQTFGRTKETGSKIKECLKQEWIEDLKEVLQTAIRAEEILDEIKSQICINGEEVFNMID